MALRIAIPNKGRLNERTVELLIKSGLELDENWGRKLFLKIEKQDIEILFVRAQDIPEFVNSGSVDIGVTGEDQVAESGFKPEILLKLGFGFCRLVVAAPEKSKIKSIKSISNGTIIATSFPNITKKYFEKNKKKVEIINVSGAAEIMPYMGVSDIIVDLVSTGSTLKTNRLAEIATIMNSEAVIIGNKKSVKAKKEKIEEIVSAIESVLYAETKLFIVADVPSKKMGQINKLFPGVAGPTVIEISQSKDMVAIQVVIDKDKVYESVNSLRKLGAKGILTLQMERLVP